MRIKYKRYDIMIKGLKGYSKDLVKDGIESEKAKQDLLWKIIKYPECIKYIKRHLEKGEQKKLD